VRASLVPPDGRTGALGNRRFIHIAKTIKPA
jgi:hypothetical protein